MSQKLLTLARNLEAGDRFYSELWDNWFTVESIREEGDMVRLTLEEVTGTHSIRANKKVPYSPVKDVWYGSVFHRHRDDRARLLDSRRN